MQLHVEYKIDDLFDINSIKDEKIRSIVRGIVGRDNDYSGWLLLLGKFGGFRDIGWWDLTKEQADQAANALHAAGFHVNVASDA